MNERVKHHELFMTYLQIVTALEFDLDMRAMVDINY